MQLQHEHDHGMDKCMFEKIVHGNVITDIIRMEMFVRLIDDEEDEEVLLQILTYVKTYQIMQ
jgi:hypothetical protein